MYIREITPCIKCPRNCRPARFDEDDGARAASYLLVKAMEEASGDTSSLTAYQEDADEILRKSETRCTTKRALGAIGNCGTKIGAGDCEAWQLGSSDPAIIPKQG